MWGKKIVTTELSKEKIKNVRFLYISIDDDLKVYYEFGNKGYIVFGTNPLKMFKDLEKKMVQRSLLKKKENKNIVGVLQLWVFYTKHYSYARVRGLGMLPEFKGNHVKALFKLVKAMDDFAREYQLKFVEAETNIISPAVMERYGFIPEPDRNILHRFAQLVLRQTHYTKRYF